MFVDHQSRCHQRGTAWLTAADLARITEGTLCQLQAGPGLCWARVSYRSGEHLAGTVADAPADGRLRFGKPVRFETRHIIQAI